VKRYRVKALAILTAVILFSPCTDSGLKFLKAADIKPVIPAIRIASFNMQIFGKTKLNRPDTLTVLAQIASNFDIIALQEVGTNKANVSDENCIIIMNAYVSRINEISGKDHYSYIRGNQYAIVYRTDKVRVNNFHLYTGSGSFSFTPLVANFETITPGSSFDFSIITIHTSPRSAEEEIYSLKTAIEETRELFSEPDVLCIGDYNADGNYYNEGCEEWLSGFDPDLYITGITNSMDTTVAESSNTYDRIQMTMSLDTDYTGKSGVFIFGEIYDITDCEGGRTTAGTEKAISDHYPVWCEYYIDRDED